MKKILTLLLLLLTSLFFTSCSIYVNCNFNKVPQNNVIQKDSTNIQPNEYWF